MAVTNRQPTPPTLAEKDQRNGLLIKAFCPIKGGKAGDGSLRGLASKRIEAARPLHATRWIRQDS
jgi:hypothetical protein